MKILVLNRGSSSIKCSVYDFDTLPNSPLPPTWEATAENRSTAAIQNLLRGLKSIDEIDVIGHRIVHGGVFFSQSVLIDADVKKKIGDLAELAPLHNLADLEGIEVFEKLLPNTPQVAVFDTAFHSTMPMAAQVYPGPYEWFEQGIKKYGFHGISYQFCTRQAAILLKKVPHRMVICHLGAGASLCAVKDGKCVDTTMGFTPLDGLMMNTRCGSIDPGILLFLQKKRVADLSDTLYKGSGLLGVSGISGDMRDLMEKRTNPRAELALEVYLHRLVSEIGAMVAVLGGLDVLVFTAGIGENSPFIREGVCEALAFLKEVKVLVIHTQESFEIARECYANQS
ncbi:MAG: acetate/propionate family kinase [Verrucomicrobia bacterium]|nr:acetate/propionate family kinase [Verrucomicrobiota bacterium]